MSQILTHDLKNDMLLCENAWIWVCLTFGKVIEMAWAKDENWIHGTT